MTGRALLPAMQGTNSSGLRISLLLTELSLTTYDVSNWFSRGEYDEDQGRLPQAQATLIPFSNSSAITPELSSSVYMESSATTKLASPTSSQSRDFSSQNAHDFYQHSAQHDRTTRSNHPDHEIALPAVRQRRHTTRELLTGSNDDEQNPPKDSFPTKRHPCRFKQTLGCKKTFTTSGHASRHSRIHIAKKGIDCMFCGCHKKFTRTDNMKQHLETHYKDPPDDAASSHKLQRSAARQKLAAIASFSDSHSEDLSLRYERCLAFQSPSFSQGTSLVEGHRIIDLDAVPMLFPSGLDALVEAVAIQGQR
jgi:hypothetical protein